MGYSSDGFSSDGRRGIEIVIVIAVVTARKQIWKIPKLHIIFLDVNECVTVSPCHTNATCNNTEGSYRCTCDYGYSGDGLSCDGRPMWYNLFSVLLLHEIYMNYWMKFTSLFFM